MDDDFDKILKNYQHSKIMPIYGSCGEEFFICELEDEKDLTMLTLKHHEEFRVLMPNEDHYKQYNGKREQEEKSWLGSNLISRLVKSYKKET